MRNIIVLLTGAALAPSALAQDAPDIRGVITAASEATIAVDYSARIVRLPVPAGGAFRQGDLLIGFDCGKFQAEVKAAKAAAYAKDLIYSNAAKLAKRGAAAAHDVAVAQAESAKAHADVQAIAARTGACEFRAPFDGRVVTQMIHAQESPGPNQPLIRIVSTAKLEIEVLVPSNWLTWLKPGAAFEFKIDETGERLPAAVDRIGATVDPVSKTVRVYGHSAENSTTVLPGMSGTATFANAGS